MKIAYRTRHLLCLITVLTLGISATPATANDEATALNTASLFRAARKVISTNQALINDASKGDKGLDGANVVATTKANYKEATGNDVEENDVTAAMFSAITDVMDAAQDLINEEGKGFKGFLPAIFAGQVAKSFSEKMAGKMSIKLTAPKNYVRNRRNRPDKWEHGVIEDKFKSDSWENGKSFHEATQVKGKDVFRLILPEYYSAGCLKCHGDPKGEIDISGGKKEGGKLGELGGAISVVIYK